MIHNEAGVLSQVGLDDLADVLAADGAGVGHGEERRHALHAEAEVTAGQEQQGPLPHPAHHAHQVVRDRLSLRLQD
jgi:hypothetical protein